MDMIQAYGTVGSGSCSKILQVGASRIVQLGADPGIQALDVRHLLHDLHTNGRAQQLCLGLFGGLDLHHPGGFSSLVGQKTELRHVSRNRAHDINDARIAVTASAQHRVGVHHGRGLRPGKHIALSRLVTHRVHIAGAGKGILVHQAQLLQLSLVELLLGVHKFIKNKILQEILGHVWIERTGISRELLLGHHTRVDELLHQIKHGSHHLQSEGRDQMVILAGNGNQTLRAKQLTVADNGLHDLCHLLPLGAVQDLLLLFR